MKSHVAENFGKVSASHCFPYPLFYDLLIETPKNLDNTVVRDAFLMLCTRLKFQHCTVEAPRKGYPTSCSCSSKPHRQVCVTFILFLGYILCCVLFLRFCTYKKGCEIRTFLWHGTRSVEFKTWLFGGRGMSRYFTVRFVFLFASIV